MAVTARASGQATAYLSGTRIATFTKPAGIVEGDTIVVAVGQAAASVWTVPAGFSKIGPNVVDGPAGNTTQVWVKVAGPSEPSTYTFTSATNSFCGLSLNAYAGCVAAMPLSRWAAQANATAATADFLSVTAPTSGGLLLLIAGMTTGVTPATPSGFTSRNAPARLLFYESTASPSSGATGVKSVAFTVGQASTPAVTILLQDTLVAPFNVELPTVSGNRYVGQTLTGATGAWLGAVSFSQQWKNDGVNLSGATNTTYQIQTTDLGDDLTYTVTASNGAGSTAATSAALEPTFHNTTLPSITGTAGAGNTYTAVAGVYDETIDTRTYKWLSDGTVVHTGSTFTPGEEEGSRVTTVREEVTGPLGSGSATSTDQRLFYAMQIPFQTAGSPWYEPLPADVPIDSALSSTLQAYLTSRYSAGGVWYGSGGPYGDSWTSDINIVDNSMAKQQWNVVDGSGNITTATKNGGIKQHLAWSWKTKNGGVPVPPGGYKVTGGTDKHIIVFNRETNEYWGAWLANIAASPLPTIQHGCYIPDVTQFIGYFQDLHGGGEGYAPGGSSEYQYLAWGETAAFNIYMGMLTQKEMQTASAGGTVPGHALAVALPGTDHTARFPALRTENRGSAPLPMGGIWTLARDFDVTSLPSTGNANADIFRRWFAEMVQTYGMIVNDTTAGNFNIRFEGVRGALAGGGSYAPNSFNWGSLYTKTLQSIVTSIPVGNWQVVSEDYRPANGPQLPEPVGIDTLVFVAGSWGFSGGSFDGANRLLLTPTAVSQGSVAYPTGGFNYTLEGHRVYWEVVQVEGTTAHMHAYASSNPATDAMKFIIDPVNDTLVAQLKDGGVTQGTDTSVAWSPTNHRWLSLREDAGDLIWEAAPDDGLGRPDDWNVIRTLATPGGLWDITGCAPGFQAFGNGSGTTIFRNLNTTPEPIAVSAGWVIGIG